MQSARPTASSHTVKNSVAGSMPQQLLAEGKEQEISVFNRTMLRKLMAGLGVGSEPKFKTVVCGDQGVKVSIEFEMRIEGQTGAVIVESDQFDEISKAEENAITLAIKIIEQKGKIRIMDFSSRLANYFNGQSTEKYVNEAIGHVGKMLDKIQNTLEAWKDLALQLEGKEVFQTVHGNISGEIEIYSSLNKFLSAVVRKFSRKTSCANSKMDKLKFERLKYEEKMQEKGKYTMTKGQLKKLCLNSKDVLDYVLSYLGFGKANYINAPDGRGGVSTEVVFNVPYMKKVKYCGNIKISWQGRTSVYSEEETAYKALLFIEDNYNVTIVDFNHPERVEAENYQKVLVKMLRDIINIASDVRNMWEKLVETIEAKLGQFNSNPAFVYESHLESEQIDAYNFCSGQLEDLGEVSANNYEECLPLFEEMQTLTWELSVLKIKLDIY